MRLTFRSLAIATALALAPPTASAQDEAVRAEARREFEAGLAAARSGDWSRAHDHFARAYEIMPVPGVLMNLAGAQRHTRRYVESAESYRRWLAEVGPDHRDARHRESVVRALAELEAATPRVTVTVTNLTEGDQLQIDGETVRSIRQPIALNPGPHRATVVRDGQVVAETEFELEEGVRVAIALGAPVRTVAPTPREVAVQEAARRSAETEQAEHAEQATQTAAAAAASTAGETTGTTPPPQGGDDAGWVALGVVLGLAAAAGAGIGIYVATQGGGPTPFRGNFGMGTVLVP